MRDRDPFDNGGLKSTNMLWKHVVTVLIEAWDESVNKPLGMVHAMFVKARSAVCFSGIINLHVCPKKFNRGTSLITMIIKSVISKNMLNDLYIYNMYSLSAIFLKISSVTKKKLCWKPPKTKPDRLTYRQVKGILLSIQRVACGIKKNTFMYTFYVIYWSQLDTKFEGSF